MPRPLPLPSCFSSPRRFLPLAALLAGLAQPALAAGEAPPPELASLAARAAGGDLDAARALRAAGPAGLSALVDAAVPEPGRIDEGSGTPSAARGGARFGELPYRQALDLVCAQVDCHASRLYWHTDFEAARREAARSGKPILSLRLLGRLDEELSCANSRFFRLLLYSDPAVSAAMRERVVLHWSSERPVPKVTVDYGDGRRLVGTVTGNSVHYLLDARGRLVDALPGLHAPHRFLAWVEEGARRATEWAPLADTELLARVRAEHARAAGALADSLVGGLRELGWDEGAARAAWQAAEPPALAEGADEPAPTAADAAPLAVAKSMAELPVLAALGMPPPAPRPELAVAQLARSGAWRAALAPESVSLVLARAPAHPRDGLEGALERLRESVSEDGLRNEAFLHRRIHERLAASAALPDWRAFNAWVYAELFLTPAGDPWLGLAPSELLSAVQPAS